MMRRPLIRTAVAAAALTAALAAPTTADAAPAAPTSGRPATSVLIVHVARTALVRALAHTLSRGADRLAVRHTFPRLAAFSVGVPAATADREAARLRALAGVTSVERPVQRNYAGTAVPVTNDPNLGKQQGYLGAVRAPQAWARQHANADVSIAVLDSGVDVDHPDLHDKIAKAYNANDPGAPVTDDVGHGTFVAGVAAAGTDNGVGVAGAGYDASIYAVKIADPYGELQIDDEVAGIEWAAAQHADVINLSLGGPEASSAERAAITHAQHVGVLVVAAAGNEGDTVRQYPAAYPGVIAVGATDTGRRTRASFSSHGSWVTVSAPGVHIYSTVPPGGSQLWTSAESSTGYASGDGTSFSTPLVAGEAALLVAENPAAGATRIRAAIVASAHGYRSLGLGTGQVDFARGLAHVPPPTAPSALAVAGTSGRVRLTAASTAPAVAFQIGSAPRRAPVATSAGHVSSIFSTWGYRNGPHSLRAVDCTAYAECGDAVSTSRFAIANPPATITGPAPGARVTGLVTVRATNPVGGPLRLLVGGHPYGLLDAAPYAFTISASALTDASHTLTVQGCSVDHHHCQGPVSAPVTVRTAGLHPRITALSPGQISPNHDGVRDTATLHFTLAEAQDVRVVVRSGRTVVRSASLGRLTAGRHTWTWRGLRSNGLRLPDGKYTLALATARGTQRGWVTRTTVIDTRRPSLTHPSGAGRLIYPYPDGYRDALTVHTRLSAPGTLTLVVRDPAGSVIRTSRLHHAAGAATVTWDGRNDRRVRVAAATYRWQLLLTDAAGNTGRTSEYAVRVSAKRLVTETVGVTRTGRQADHAGGTSSCAYTRGRESTFTEGLRLVNGCPASGFDLAFADYTFTAPAAVRYSSISFQALGFATRPPSEITAAFAATDGSVEIPRYQRVGARTATWYTIATVPAAGHVTSTHRVHISLLLDSYYAGRNDFDVAQVRVWIRLTALR